MKCLAASRAISIAPVTLVAKVRSKLARSKSTSFLKVPRPGVVDQDVEIAEFFQNLAHGALDVGFLGYVGLDGMRAQLFGGLVELGFIAPGDGHARAAIDQALGDAVSDARTSAGDESYCVFQIHS